MTEISLITLYTYILYEYILVKKKKKQKTKIISAQDKKFVLCKYAFVSEQRKMTNLKQIICHIVPKYVTYWKKTIIKVVCILVIF